MVTVSNLSLPDTDSLTSFFEQLRAAQYRLNPKQLAAAYRILLSAHAENWTIDRLQFVLMILLAKTRQEQREFPEHFDLWLGRPTVGVRVSSRYSVTSIAGMIALAVLVAILMCWLFRGVPSKDVAKDAVPPLAPGSLDAISNEWVAIIHLLAFVPLVAFLVWMAVRRRGGRAPESEARSIEGAIEFDQIEAIPNLSQVLGGPALNAIARELRRHRPTSALELDISATVEATAHQAGHFCAVWRNRVRRPEYVVLIEENSRRDHIARIMDAIIDRLKKLEVGIQRFYFSGDPRVVVRDDRNRTSVSLAAVGEQTRHARLLILATGRGLVNPLTDQLWPKIKIAMQPWTDKIFLSTEPMKTWGEREHQLLRDGFSIGTASFGGFVAVATRVAQGSSHSGVLLEGQQRSLIAAVDSGSESSSLQFGMATRTKGEQKQGQEEQGAFLGTLSKGFHTVGVSVSHLVRVGMLKAARLNSRFFDTVRQWARQFAEPFRVTDRTVDALKTDSSEESYLVRVEKIVPVEPLCAWVVVLDLLRSTALESNTLQWSALAIFTIVTPAWTLTRTSLRGPRYSHAALSTCAFLVWAFALGEPFNSLRFYSLQIGSLLLVFFTLISGLIVLPPKTEWFGETTGLGNQGSVADGYFDRLRKYFPTETVVFWISCTGLAGSTLSLDSVRPPIIWAIFSVGLIATPLLVLIRSRSAQGQLPLLHAVVSTTGFVVWAFAIHVPFFMPGMDVYGALALAAYSLLAGLVVLPTTRLPTS